MNPITDNNLPDIPESDIKKSPILSIIYGDHPKPIVFLPNYGEFGPTIDKLIKIVHFTKSPYKIVCCRHSEAEFFPSANTYYSGWNYDLIEDTYRWGFFTKRKILLKKGKRVVNPYAEKYWKEADEDIQKIKERFGNEYEYIDLRGLSSDMTWTTHYSHLFRFKFETGKMEWNFPDVVISPRNKLARKDNNFEHWEDFIKIMNNNGYSAGCIGSKESSFEIPQSIMNSWAFTNNGRASIEMLSHCKLYVGLDTGPSHLASFMSIPMIVFQHNDPNSSGTWVIEKMTQGWFCDLGKNVTNYDIISNKALEYLASL